MGRNIKEGLSYFPLDIDFFEDEKVQFISARFGVKGDGILIRLLCRIYRQGYGLEFNDDIALLFARSVGDINLHGLVKEVVNELLKRGFFDEAVFKRFGLLTSKGIQKRYAKICTDAKRKNWQIPEKFDLIRSKCQNTPEEIEETPEESTQRKEKKSKVKKSKEREHTQNILSESNLFLKPQIPTKEEVQRFFIGAGGTMEMAEKFYNKHDATGWYVNNTPIKNFRTLVYGFIDVWKKYNKEPEVKEYKKPIMDQTLNKW